MSATATMNGESIASVKRFDTDLLEGAQLASRELW